MEVRRATGKAIREAAARLRAGKLVAFPTETVYGLGADAANASAVATLFATKERPRFNPLIVHVADAAQAGRLGVFHEPAHRLAEQFWPGPLTLVLPRHKESGIGDLVTAGLDTIAIRVPEGAVARALLQEFGGPIAAPSANRSGGLSPTTAEHVAEDFAEFAGLILDGGPCAVGIESTVIGFAGEVPLVLRPGAVPREAIEAVLNTPLQPPDALGGVVSPGQTASHYAPRAALRLNATDPREGEALLSFGPDAPPGHFSLSPTGDLVEAAASLFTALRTLDATGVAVIAVSPIPGEGLGEAINDRLRRAAAPRGG